MATSSTGGRHMSLKDEADAMRLHLSQRDLKSTMARTASVPIGKKSSNDSGKYSVEILNKKIKKVEKMIANSPPGSKECTKLQKKLVEYRAELRNQTRIDIEKANAETTSSPTEVEVEESSEVQEESTNNSVDNSVPTMAKEGTDDQRMKEKSVKQDEDKGHSLELLNKKLRKVEKMLLACTPGSKEHQKLQKKRTEYERQIENQKHETTRTSIGSDKGSKQLNKKNEECQNKVEQESQASRRNELREEAKILREKALEKKRKERESVESAARAEEELRREEAEKEERQKHADNEADILRKKAFREEAAKLMRKKALEKKQKEKEARELAERTKEELKQKEATNQKARSSHEGAVNQGDSKVTEIGKSNGTISEANIFLHYANDEKTRKQAFLEEARKLKQAAAEKKRKEEETNRKDDKKSDTEKQSIVANDRNHESEEWNPQERIYNIDEKKRRQAFLEEAQRLKQETMGSKRKEKDVTNIYGTSPAESKGQDHEACNEDYTRNSERETEKSPSNYSDDHDKKLDYPVETQSNVNENEKRPETVPPSSSVFNVSKPKLTFLNEIRLSANKDEDVAIVSNQESNSDTHKPDFLDEVQLEANKKETCTPGPNTTVHRTKRNFLDEIRSKVEKIEDGAPAPDLECSHRSKPNFLNDIEPKAGKTETSALVNELHARRPMSNLLDEIQLKVKKMKSSEPANDANMSKSKPDFLNDIEPKAGRTENSAPVNEPQTRRPMSNLLDEIRWKAKKMKSSEPANDVNMSKSKPDFLNEIESKVGKTETSAPVNEPHARRPMSNLLDEIRLKAEKMKSSEPANDSKLSKSNPEFLNEIESKVGKTETSAPVNEPHARRPMSNLLDEIRLKAEKMKSSEPANDSKLSKSNPEFLNEIESKVGKTETSAPVNEPHARRPMSNLLDEIRLKAEKMKSSEPANDSNVSKSKPNFLDEIKSIAEKQKETPSPAPEKNEPKKKTNFLNSIRSRIGAKGGKQKEGKTAQIDDSNMRETKLNFLEELRSKAESHKEAKEASHSVASLGIDVDGTHSTTDSVEAKILQSQQQLDPKSTGSVSNLPTDQSPSDQGKEPSKDYLDLRTLPEPYTDNTKKLLRELETNDERRKKLERSLMQNGIPISEEISYEEAKDKIAEITESMKSLTVAGMDSFAMEKKYFQLEEELSKYTAALMLTDEYAKETRRLEQEWEDSIEGDNIIAIRKLRSHMPVTIRHMTEDQLATAETPNGMTLPKAFARKFKRTNILQLIRVDPGNIEMMHPSLVEGMRTAGLTLTERRALHHHLKDVGERWAERRADPSIEKKWQWYQILRSKFKETLNAYLRCVEQHGPPENHKYAKRNDTDGSGCRLIGNQCPIKADATFDYSQDYGYTKDATYESSSDGNQSTIDFNKGKPASKDKFADGQKASEAEILEEYRHRLRMDAHETEVDKKLLRELYHSNKRLQRLEKQLTNAGLSLPKEDVPYSVAKTRIAELTADLQKVGIEMGSTNDSQQMAKLEYTFGQLSQELDKYTNALMLTKEWAQEQKEKERQWEVDVSCGNYEALQKLRRHMPVGVRNMSESSLATEPTPNGKILPKAMAKKFKRTNILMILRTDPSAIEQMHPSSLEGMRTTGLTLTERRAIHEHLKDVAPKWKATAGDKMCERKWMWHASLQSKLREMLERYDKHIEEYGPPGSHECPLIGNQCPVKADLVMDYNGDYGYPDGAEYEQQTVAKSNLLSMEELEKRRREDQFGY